MLFKRAQTQNTMGSGQVISLHIGQFGCQTGMRFWRKMIQEHGISPDGSAAPEDPEVPERRDMFFSQDDQELFVPRALFIDLEPNVVSQAREDRPLLFNDDNMLPVGDQKGAGNRWSNGYNQGNDVNVSAAMMDALRREVGFAPNGVEAFHLTHSTGGGTGSGLGSALIEHIRDEYGLKVPIVTHSLLPGDDVNPGPYNGLLAMKRLALHADCTMLYHNEALYSSNRLDQAAGMDTRGEQAGRRKNGFNAQNDIIARVMADVTAPSRFPLGGSPSMRELLASVATCPPCHFIVPSVAPISHERRLMTTSDVVKQLFGGSGLVSVDQAGHSYLASSIMLRADGQALFGTNAVTGMTDFIMSTDLKGVRFTPGSARSPDIVATRRAPHDSAGLQLSGTMLANTTAVAGALDEMVGRVDKMLAAPKIPYLGQYRDDYAEIEAELEDSREVVLGVVDAYRREAG